MWFLKLFIGKIFWSRSSIDTIYRVELIWEKKTKDKGIYRFPAEENTTVLVIFLLPPLALWRERNDAKGQN